MLSILHKLKKQPDAAEGWLFYKQLNTRATRFESGFLAILMDAHMTVLNGLENI